MVPPDRSRLLLTCVAALLLGAPASAALVTVGAGTQIDLGDADIDLGCANLSVEGDVDVADGSLAGVRDLDVESGGELLGGSGLIEIAGDWDASGGSFDAGSGTVRIGDGCGLASATVVGDNSFATFEMLTNTGKQVSLVSGSTQTITERFVARGTSGALLALRSTLAGSEAFLDLDGASQLVTFVDVQDDHAVGDAIGYPVNSTIGSNVLGWQLVPPVVSLLGSVGAALLSALLLVGGLRRGRTARGAQ